MAKLTDKDPMAEIRKNWNANIERKIAEIDTSDLLKDEDPEKLLKLRAEWEKMKR